MLIIAECFGAIRFSELMDVYAEGNAENGAQNYPKESKYQQVLNAERDFYQYLNEIFFKQSGAIYALWEQEKHYVAALRLEPYRDGLLLSALETHPDARRRGYASALIRALIDHLRARGTGILYSHVSMSNSASLALHKQCGFQISCNHAVFLDGSISSRYYTLAYRY